MHKKWRLETRIARVQHICLFLINLSAFWIIVRGPPRQLFLSFCSPEWDKTTWMKKNVRNRRSRWEVKVVVQIFESIKKRSYHHFLPIRMFLFFFFNCFFLIFFVENSTRLKNDSEFKLGFISHRRPKVTPIWLDGCVRKTTSESNEKHVQIFRNRKWEKSSVTRWPATRPSGERCFSNNFRRWLSFVKVKSSNRNLINELTFFYKTFYDSTIEHVHWFYFDDYCFSIIS